MAALGSVTYSQQKSLQTPEWSPWSLQEYLRPFEILNILHTTTLFRKRIRVFDCVGGCLLACLFIWLLACLFAGLLVCLLACLYASLLV